MQSGVYDTHTGGLGDTAPEIFLGRIDASRMTGDAEDTQINDYLDKLHAWYSLQLPMTNYALTYTEDDWSSLSYFWTDIGYAFPDNEAIKAPDTDRDDYSDNRLTSPVYQFIQLSCHSNAFQHYFTRGGTLNGPAIKAIPPKALFYNLFCCSAMRYTSSDFLGGAYVFNPSTTALATIGSTKTGSMLNFWAFYQPLGEGKTLGQAFNDWFNTIAPYSYSEICWHYGMTITGDPLVVPVASEPSNIVLIQPNGGEVLLAGEEYEIRWLTPGGPPDSISILLSLDSGETYPFTVASGLSGTDSTYVWTIDDLPVSLSRIKVEAWHGGVVDDYDFSDSDFVIQGGPYKYVSTTGGNIFPYSAPAWAALSIQDALDAASDGDTIMIETGTYNEAVTVQSPVYILGGWDVGFTNRDSGVYPSTINSIGSPVSFIMVPGDGSGIEGCNITGGSGTSLNLPVSGIYGGGILAYDASPLIKGNTIDACGYVTVTQYSAGGGICCYLGDVEIIGNTLTDCVAQSGGGIYLYQVTATLTGNTVTGSQPNAEFTGTRYGGGICSRNSEVIMSGNVITSNTGFVSGAGIYSYFGSLSLDGDTIASNECSSSGGGIMSERTSLSVSRGVITENTAGTGAGIMHKAAAFDMDNSLVALNTASLISGGISADSCWGIFENNTIDGNSGLYVGGNLMLSNALGLTIRNNNFTGGSPSGFHATAAENITYTYNNAYGNTGGDVIGITPDATNMSTDPLYVDLPGADYHLGLFSPGIDAGDPAGGDDPDGSRADIGMFGGPDALWLQPDFVQNCAATASSDTAISVSWIVPPIPDGDYFAVFGDTVSGFDIDAEHLLGTVPNGQNSFDHHPVSGCWYYKVCAVDDSGYSGGYSSEVDACADGADMEDPVVTIVHPDGAETFTAGDPIEIEWIATDDTGVDSVTIACSINGGTDWTVLASGEPNDSSYTWDVPIETEGSDSCLVRVTAYDPSLNAGSGQSGDYFTIQEYVTDAEGTPAATALHQNYPNPFNGHTTISYSLERPEHVSIRIYDTAGRHVRTLEDRDRGAGMYQTVWDGRDNASRPVASGIYFMRMQAGDYGKSRKIVYLR